VDGTALQGTGRTTEVARLLESVANDLPLHLYLILAATSGARRGQLHLYAHVVESTAVRSEFARQVVSGSACSLGRRVRDSIKEGGRFACLLPLPG
jgi:hypothetical protein